MHIHKILIPAIAIIVCIACTTPKEPVEEFTKTNTEEVTDSMGHKLEGGMVYAKITVDEPTGISDVCKKNFAMWLSTVLEIEKTSDKNAVHSLEKSFTQSMSSRLQKDFSENKDDFQRNGVNELYSITEVRKISEDTKHITFAVKQESYNGGVHGSHSYQGYTFDKTDFSLTDLLDKSKTKAYREAITSQLAEQMNMSQEQLMDFLLIEDDCKKEGLVPLPANGAYLDGDTLVFQYQEYEIAPYSSGMPCARIPLGTEE